MVARLAHRCGRRRAATRVGPTILQIGTNQPLSLYYGGPPLHASGQRMGSPDDRRATLRLPDDDNDATRRRPIGERPACAPSLSKSILRLRR
jgi:hypothetical protein